jgi:hypothetical protein
MGFPPGEPELANTTGTGAWPSPQCRRPVPPQAECRESLIDLLCVSSEGAGTCAESMISNIAETCRASDENCIEDLERVIEYLMTTARAPG